MRTILRLGCERKKLSARTSKLLAVSFGWVKVMMMMGARMRSQTRWVVERRTAGMMLEWEIIKLRV